MLVACCTAMVVLLLPVQAVISFDLDADLRSVFSWNTLQLFVFLQAEYETPENKINHIVLWDSIIQSKVQPLGPGGLGGGQWTVGQG